MQTAETKYFHVIYGEEDRGNLNRILSVLDESYRRTAELFDLSETNEKFDFILCPDVNTFKEKAHKTDEEYQPWMVGCADYPERRLCVLSPGAVHDRSFDDMLAVIRHEAVHIAFDQLQNADKANIMVSEGIAVALAGQVDADLLSETEYPDVRKMTDEEYFYENNGYLYSGVYVMYLLGICGRDTFKDIYAGIESMEKYLYDGFEIDAIRNFRSLHGEKHPGGGAWLPGNSIMSVKPDPEP